MWLTPKILIISGLQKGQTHFCSLSGSIENYGNLWKTFNLVLTLYLNLQAIYILEIRLNPIILIIMLGFQRSNPFFAAYRELLKIMEMQNFLSQFCRKRSTWSCRYISAFQPKILEIIILMMSISKNVKPIFAAYREVLKIMDADFLPSIL